MPTLRQLVATIKEDYFPSYSPDKILGYIDRLQRAVFQRDAAQFKYLNTADTKFPYPILSTTATKLAYDITNANLVDSDGNAITMTVGGKAVVCRKIVKVFYSASTDYHPEYIGEPFSLNTISPYWNKRTYGNYYYSAPGRITNGTNGFNSRFQFFEDPGTSTNRFYVDFFYAPVELTSDSIPMFISINDWEEALIDGVVGIIQSIAGPSEMRNKWENYWMPRIISDYNDGMEQESPEQMPARECG